MEKKRSFISLASSGWSLIVLLRMLTFQLGKSVTQIYRDLDLICYGYDGDAILARADATVALEQGAWTACR
jgi:hypothetical protein